MKTGLFLRNPASLEEYLIFSKHYPEYLEAINYDIIREINLTFAEYQYFTERLLEPNRIIESIHDKLIIDANNIAHCLEIQVLGIPKLHLFSNGYAYAKYIFVLE